MIFPKWFKRSINQQVVKRSSVKISVLCEKRRFEPKYILNPGGPDSKEPTCILGEPGSIPGLGRSPGEGNGNLFQYSYLENPRDVGVWWATVHGSQRARHNWATNNSNKTNTTAEAETNQSKKISGTFWVNLSSVSVIKNPPANSGDMGSIPESRRSLAE